MFNTATLITLIRIVALPFLALCFLGGYSQLTLGLFVLAALSDYVDGWIARKYNQQTPFGAMLDQISDKLLIGVMLVLLASTGRLSDAAVLAAVCIIIREIGISGIREYLGNQQIVVPVIRLAKYKTAVQMAAITVLLLAGAMPWFLSGFLYTAGEALLVAAAGLSLWTGALYVRAARPHFS